MGGWLIWEPCRKILIQSERIIFPGFQSAGDSPTVTPKQSLGDVPTENFFEEENREVYSFPLAKDMTIPQHLGEAVADPNAPRWKEACKDALDQMRARDVWKFIYKQVGMKTIGHLWVFDVN
ncbi:hypothetical protein O181_004395 [Austropuccinia psidii MF-1]|uniref:Uncharacterized protein n=1 Tax=Austropuccinia psidii MF-1 TaxID=1389203 RepID=A0A9Q3GET8_9BASI|nr:hypothetical protein [Austropuccinia psidii MF-1]